MQSDQYKFLIESLIHALGMDLSYTEAIIRNATRITQKQDQDEVVDERATD